jgi:CheY-like chemotaxis protein
MLSPYSYFPGLLSPFQTSVEGVNKPEVTELIWILRRADMSQFMTLVVENDTLQREFIADLIKDRGLEVIECTTAEAAELVLAAAGLELRAVVTDVNLNGVMTGIELAEFAKSKFPSLNVVIISGKAPARLPNGTRFLQKPYQAAELLEAVLE